MPATSVVTRRSGCAAALAVLLAATAVSASERSEILVAKGEVAFHQARYDDAIRLLEEAVAADPGDASAHDALAHVLLERGRRDEAIAAFERALAIDPSLEASKRGLATARGETLPTGLDRVGGTVGELGRLPSVRTEEDEKRWSVNATVGLQYDSNVKVEPDGRASAGLGDKDDMAFVFGFGAEYDVVSRSNLLVRLEYDIYQTLHPNLDDFNFRSQQPRVTTSFGVTEDLWAGVQGGYDYYTLGSDTYQGEPHVMPFLSYLEGDWGLTQLIYRWGEDTYFSDPFNDQRDGPNQTFNLGQTLYFSKDRYVTVGYQWNEENPDRTAASYAPFTQNNPEFVTNPNDWQVTSNQGYLGLGLPVYLGAYVDLLYLYRADDYRWPNSFAGYRRKRRDEGHFLYAGITRPITDHVAVAVTYYGSFNGSNVDDFEYNRNVVATLLQVTY